MSSVVNIGSSVIGRIVVLMFRVSAIKWYPFLSLPTPYQVIK